MKRCWQHPFYFTIQSKLLLVLLFQMIIFICFYFYMFYNTQQKGKEQFLLDHQKINIAMANRLEYFQSNLARLSTFPIEREKGWKTNDIYNFLSSMKDHNGTMAPPMVYYDTFHDFSVKLLQSYDFIEFVGISDLNGNTVFRSRENSEYRLVAFPAHDNPWVTKTLSLRGGFHLFPTGMVDIQNTNASNCIVATRAIIRTGKYDPLGIIFLGINASTIETEFYNRSLFPQQKMFVFTPQKESLLPDIVSPDLRSIIEKNEMGEFVEKNNIYDLYKDPQNGLTFAIQTLKSNRQVYFQSQGFFWGSYIFLCVMTILMIYTIFSSITKPVKNLIDACKKIEGGDYKPTILIPRNNELYKLKIAIESMSVQVDTLVNEVLKKEVLHKELEMQMLRAQINPHFLYNTLEFMQMQAFLQKNDALASMCNLLGELLRTATTSRAQLVSVADEMDYIQKYIQLIQFRYPQIIFSFCIDEDIYHFKMLGFLLQPLIENAIGHGVCENGNQGRIDILGYQEGDLLCFKVFDDGVGMDEAHLQELRTQLKQDCDQHSIGLRNVNRRIKLYYGAQYEVQIQSIVSKGTIVALEVPFDLI